MRKHIFSCFCMILTLLMLTGFNVIANSSEQNSGQASEVLTELGIIKKTQQSKATRDFVVSSLAGFVYDDTSSINNEDFARMFRIIEQTEKYNGKANVTANETIKYCVIALGYGPLAEQRGGQMAEYLSIASDIKLTKGISFDSGTTISVGDCIKLFYNMLDIEPMVVNYDGNISIRQNETLLSINRNIKKIKGIYTANENTSIYSEYGTLNGYIEIDYIEYLYNGDNKESLGKCIEAFILEDDSEDEVIYLYESGEINNEYSFESKEIIGVDTEFSEFYYEEKGRKKIIKLSDVPKIIYNGCFYDDYVVSDFKPLLGNVVLIDNDNNKTADVIFINSYETMVVESVDSYNKEIYGKYRHLGAIDKIELEPIDKEIKYEISDGQRKMDITDIKPMNVLNVARSYGVDKQIIKIIVSTQYINDKVKSITNDEYGNLITIGSKKYRVAPDYEKELQYEGRTITLGKLTTYYVDSFGNIAYMNRYVDGEYYLFRKPIYDEENDSYYIECMNMSGEWERFEISDKITIGKISYKQYEAYDRLRGVSEQIVRVSLNYENKIKKIEFAQESAVADENKFTKRICTNMRYHSPQTFRNLIYLDAEALVIIIPEDKTDKNKYSVQKAGAFFINEKTYSFVAYDIDEYGFTNILTVVDDGSVPSSSGGQWFLVTKKIQTVNAEDEPTTELIGCYGPYIDISFLPEDESLFDNISKGDILDLSLSVDGTVKDINNTVYSYSSGFHSNIEDDYYSNHNLVLAGIINEIDIEGERFQIRCGTEIRSFRLNTNTLIRYFAPSSTSMRISSAANLKRGDKIVCRMEYGAVQEMIIYTE